MNDHTFAIRQLFKGPSLAAAATLATLVANAARGAETFDWPISSPEEAGLDSTALIERTGLSDERFEGAVAF
jgi:hypothetical protein